MNNPLPDHGGSNYPMLGYEYNQDGRYGEPRHIKNDGQLRCFFVDVVKPAIKEKREIRITNSMDEMLFHAKDGRVLFGGKTVRSQYA